MSKPNVSPPSGMRDFPPAMVHRRNHIFRCLRRHFEAFGFQPIETPSMERSSVLKGKYGEEGDKLIYDILNSGDFTAKLTADDLLRDGASEIAPKISEKSLRYDLTVPFARYVVAHRNELELPFKRYQIQPVWRADRPQKGRYREFWQCDADVVGADSRLLDAEFLKLYDAALTELGLPAFTIRINHRGLLQALAEVAGEPGRFTELCVAIDKLDKIGRDGVEEELRGQGFDEAALTALAPIYELSGDAEAVLDKLADWLYDTAAGGSAVADMRKVLAYVEALELETAELRLDLTLARGLDYYTGIIYEVTSEQGGVGSIGGGGRYDDLAGQFGWKNLPGVGISFGADRIYDVMEALGLFDHLAATTTRVLLINFGGAAEQEALRLLNRLRAAGIPSELYPEAGKKIAKQYAYADKKGIPYAVAMGEAEVSSGQVRLKDLHTGQEVDQTWDNLLDAVARGLMQ